MYSSMSFYELNTKINQQEDHKTLLPAPPDILQKEQGFWSTLLTARSPVVNTAPGTSSCFLPAPCHPAGLMGS